MDDDRDRIASTGERPVKPNITMDQPLSPKDERIVSANPSPDAAITGPSSSRDGSQQKESSTPSLELVIPPQFSSHGPSDQNTYYGGYGNSTATWDGYSQNMNADGFNMTPVMYGDNSSLMSPFGYGFNPEMPYGQYSPFASPFSPVMVDGQLYSPQFSPTYYQPNMSGAFPVAQSELMTPESGGDGLLYSPGTGYMMPFGSYGGGNVSGNLGSSSLPSPAAYPQQMSILGSYEQSIGQRSMQGYGLPLSSSNSRYPHGGSYQSSNFGYTGANDRNRLGFDKNRRRERDSDVISIFSSSYGADTNRGPRASKSKGKSITDLSSSSTNSKNDLSASEIQLNLYSGKDFVTDYDNAKFFIIKSFSEDNIHRSIKYNVWASTPNGNKKLDAAYNEAKDMSDKCPVFLFFSVNASGQFCGVAEMIGPVDFEKDADHWQQDRWSGQFPVQWHIIKDVPNSRFRHIILENNENKPVTHSRDSQEVKLEQGIEMLKIFKEHEARTSILDDFDFYNERETVLKEIKTKQLTTSNDRVSDGSSTNVPKLREGKLENTPSETGSCSGFESSVLVDDDNINQITDKFSESLVLEGNGQGRK